MFVKIIILFVAVTAIIYILYQNGICSFSSKKALLFIGKNNISQKNLSAVFKACTGYIRRVLILNKDCEYTFTFDCNLENGEIKAVIRNCKKQELFTLTPENNNITLMLDSGKYYLSVECYKAYGNYKFSWK